MDTYERQHAIEKALYNEHGIEAKVWKQHLEYLGTSLDIVPKNLEEGFFIMSLLEEHGASAKVCTDHIEVNEKDFAYFKCLLSTLTHGEAYFGEYKDVMMQNQAY